MSNIRSIGASNIPSEPLGQAPSVIKEDRNPSKVPDSSDQGFTKTELLILIPTLSTLSYALYYAGQQLANMPNIP